MALTKVGKEGVVGLDNSADATAITIDSDENVAIGVTSKNSSNNGSLTIGHTGMTKITTAASGNADELVIIGANASANVGMSIIANNANQSNIFLGDEDDTDIGGITYNHADNSMSLITNTATGLKIDSTGAVTKPLQPAFMVHPASSQTNIAINGSTNVVFGTERFDNNGDFSSNNFTAPVTGKYQLQYTAVYNSPDISADYVEHLLVTSNKSYQSLLDPDGFDASPLYHTFNFSYLVDMDANDTATINIGLNNTGSAQMDISTSSFFSGYLVC